MNKPKQTFYARHVFRTDTEITIRIKADNLKTAREINENWCFGTTDKRVVIVTQEDDQSEYRASDVWVVKGPTTKRRK